MLLNYIKVALRWLYIDRKYILFNVISLTLGFSSFLILATYVIGQLSYDRHNSNYSQIYRLIMQSSDNSIGSSRSPSGFAPQFTTEYPLAGIEEYTRFKPLGRTVLKSEPNGESGFSDNVYLADPNVFRVFTHEIIAGDPETALIEPTSIAISQSIAEIHFGNKSPIGRQLSTETGLYNVSLVFKDHPENSHFKYDALLSYNLFIVRVPNSRMTLTDSTDFTYLLANESFSKENFENYIVDFYTKYIQQDVSEVAPVSFVAQPLSATHFDGRLILDQPHGNIYYVMGISALAVIVLVLAWVNYVNISIVRSTARTKEIVVRKILGARYSQLLTQLLGESLLITLLSVMLAIVTVPLILVFIPVENLASDQNILSMLFEPIYFSSLLFGVVLVGLVVGFVPANRLITGSSLAQPPSSASRKATKKFTLRNSLFAVQMFFAVTLVGITYVIANQVEFMLNEPLGYNPYNKIVTTLQGDILEDIEAYRNEVQQLNGVESISMTSWIPGKLTDNGALRWRDEFGIEKSQMIDWMRIDYDFIPTLGIEIAEGRNFNKDYSADASESVIANRTLMETLSLSDGEPRIVSFRGQDFNIIGMVEDFYINTLHSQVNPTLMMLNADSSRAGSNQNSTWANFVISLESTNVSSTISGIEELSQSLNPGYPFEYEFVENIVSGQYEADIVLLQISESLAFIAIVISLIGVIGLTLLVLNRRAKEFAIRRVLGISSFSLYLLSCSAFVAIFLLVSFPAVWLSDLVLSYWLQNFTYKINFEYYQLLIPTLILGFVLLITTAISSYFMHENLSKVLKEE